MPRQMYKGEMAKGCHHTNRKDRYYSPPYYGLREPQPEPTPEEINRFRLWKPKCGHWISFLGVVSQ